jgi:hypothetical protein
VPLLFPYPQPLRFHTRQLPRAFPFDLQELHDKKKQMANIIELSNLSYESRDNFQMDIAAIEQVPSNGTFK